MHKAQRTKEYLESREKDYCVFAKWLFQSHRFDVTRDKHTAHGVNEATSTEYKSLYSRESRE